MQNTKVTLFKPFKKYPEKPRGGNTLMSEVKKKSSDSKEKKKIYRKDNNFEMEKN